MLNRRHHIHLICDSKDDSLYAIQDHLAVFFEQRAFFTKDLFSVGAHSANYSWRCINACHYSIVLLGDSYGTLTNTGVSQLHISYLNAKTKNKPMVALIRKNHSDNRQLLDLIQTIQKQLAHVYYLDDDSDVEAMLSEAYIALTDEHNEQGWMTSDVLEATLEAQIEARQERQQQRIQQQADAHKADARSSNHDIKADTSSLFHTSSEDLDMAFAALDDSRTPAVTALDDEVLGNATSLLTPSLDDDLLVSCTAHAFQGGTLIEVAFMAATTWRSLLSALVHSGQAFSLQGFWRLLNELITPQAMQAVKASHPNVHAISRCQVTKADMLWIQEELSGAGWIHQVTHAPNKQMWQTSELAKGVLAEANH